MQLRRRVRVLVADDHASVRENLRYLVDAEPDLSCVAVARNGRQCLALCAELQPDVLVVDHDMPDLDGLMVTRILERMQPHIRVIVYTLSADICSVAQASGAVACIPKDAPYELLLRAIRHGAAVGSPVA